jgi:DNA-binding response OmpR family regulator
LRLFHWLCATEIPPGFDLRRCGWRLAEPGAAIGPGGGVALAEVGALDRDAWTRLRHAYPPPRRAGVLLLGVADSGERARLLGLGFGDVAGEAPALAEVEARAIRILAIASMLPRHRQIGGLRLDLAARDGFVRGRRLALHPREFALLWRLADTPGEPVGKQALMREVWRLCHVPDTNSLAVHVFRLRAKLAAAGLQGLVRTASEGGYLLDTPDEASRFAIPLLTADSSLNDLIAAETGGGDRRLSP